MPRISKETSLCISIAKSPSNFGTTLFNEAFKAQGLDFIYKACGVSDSKECLKDAIAGIKALGIKGCGVSMPFKIMAVEYMDELDQSVMDIGALNTISNESGILKGYNTDYYGAREVLGAVENIRGKTVLVLGSGGVALAICAALKSLGVEAVTITNRTSENAQRLAHKWHYKSLPWKQREQISTDLLINATNIGMNPKSDEIPLSPLSLNNFATVMDVVLSPPQTSLMKHAQEIGKQVIAGYEMSLYQAAKQYRIYTGQNAPIEVMQEAMYNLLGI